MKLFGWMQNKLYNGKQESTKHKAVPAASYPKKPEAREEFNDWPHGLLAIGTFGNNPGINRENQNNENIEEELPSSSMDLQDFTPEEIGKFEKELTKLLRRKRTSSSDNKEKEIASLPLDRFLNCPSSLEVDRRISNAICNDQSYDHQIREDVDDHDHDHQDIRDEDIDRTISVILGRCKDIRADNSKKFIGKKSLTFLLKKMFVCRGGFAPQPSLRDTLQESRMERFLRIMLHKKISSQNTPSRAQSMKKYIEDKQVSNKKGSNEHEKEKQHKIINNNNNNDGYKWVKTDSEFIVLEI